MELSPRQSGRPDHESRQCGLCDDLGWRASVACVPSRRYFRRPRSARTCNGSPASHCSAKSSATSRSLPIAYRQRARTGKTTYIEAAVFALGDYAMAAEPTLLWPNATRRTRPGSWTSSESASFHHRKRAGPPPRHRPAEMVDRRRHHQGAADAAGLLLLPSRHTCCCWPPTTYPASTTTPPPSGGVSASSRSPWKSLTTTVTNTWGTSCAPKLTRCSPGSSTAGATTGRAALGRRGRRTPPTGYQGRVRRGRPVHRGAVRDRHPRVVGYHQRVARAVGVLGRKREAAADEQHRFWSRPRCEGLSGRPEGTR